jgi:hypothetical protein
MYLDAIKSFPKGDTRLQTEKGTAHHVKTDVFKRQMWYAYDGDAAIGSGLIALEPERVREIVKMNQEGKKPKELNEFVMETVVKEPDYSNVVGQDSLNRFEHAFKTKKKKKKSGNRPAENNRDRQPVPQKNQEGSQRPVAAEGGENKQGSGNRRKKKRPNNRKGNPNAGNNENKA